MMAEESWERGSTRSLRGSPIGATSSSRPRIVTAKRVCSHDGCGTVLSCYNTKSLCWQHDPGGQYVLRVHDRRREAHAPQVFPAA
jgi:hypothetical protein